MTSDAPRTELEAKHGSVEEGVEGGGGVVSYWFLTPGQPYRSYISGRRVVVVVGGKVGGGGGGTL